jgi:hypothetical protein
VSVQVGMVGERYTKHYGGLYIAYHLLVHLTIAQYTEQYLEGHISFHDRPSVKCMWVPDTEFFLGSCRWSQGPAVLMSVVWMAADLGYLRGWDFSNNSHAQAAAVEGKLTWYYHW